MHESFEKIYAYLIYFIMHESFEKISCFTQLLSISLSLIFGKRASNVFIKKLETIGHITNLKHQTNTN